MLIWLPLSSAAEAGAGNIARAESALFALMYGPNLAQPASPFDQDSKPGRSPAPDARRASSDKGSAIAQLGRASISLRTHSSSSSSQVSWSQAEHCHSCFLHNQFARWLVTFRKPAT